VREYGREMKKIEKDGDGERWKRERGKREEYGEKE
jgi:hypothetical protein